MKKSFLALIAASAFGLGALFAAETKNTPAVCCANAAKEGKVCAHACCVEAAKQGNNCAKCPGGSGKIEKKAETKK